MQNQPSINTGTHTSGMTQNPPQNNLQPDNSSKTQSKLPRMKQVQKSKIHEASESRKSINGLVKDREIESDSDSEDENHTVEKNIKKRHPKNRNPEKQAELSEKTEIAAQAPKQSAQEIAEFFCKQLQAAIKSGDLKTVQQLIKKNPELLAIADQKRPPPIFQAANFEQGSIAEILVRAGSSLDYQDESGDTALIIATRTGQLSLVKTLIENNAQIDLANNQRWTPLMIAAKHGHYEVAEALLNGKANIDARLPDGEKAIHLASEFGKVQIIGLLIKNGANVEQEKNDGWTPLMIAAKHGQYEAAEALINGGANFDASLPDGVTALYIASKYNKKNLVELLIKKGVNYFKKKEDGSYPLTVAASLGHDEIVDRLLEHMKIERSLNPWHPYRTAYILAARKGHLKVVRAFFQHGLKINPDYDEGFWHAIIAASKNGDIKFTQYLTRNFESLLRPSGIDDIFTDLLTLTSDLAQEAIQEAVLSGADHHLVELLINSGANPNHINKQGKSMLQLAIEKGHTETTFLLAEHHIRLHRGNSGKFLQEIFSALDRPIPDSLVIDKLLDVYLKARFKWRQLPQTISLNNLFEMIRTIFIPVSGDKLSYQLQSRLIKYLCLENFLSYSVAKEIVNATRVIIEIYSNNHQGNIAPTASQLKLAFAESIAGSQLFHNMRRIDNPAPETMYDSHAIAPESAKELARKAALHGELLLTSAESVIELQQFELISLFNNLTSQTSTQEIRNWAAGAGLHPLIVERLTDLWNDLSHPRATRNLLTAIENEMNSEDFAKKAEALISDASRQLLFRQTEQLLAVIRTQFFYDASTDEDKTTFG